MVLLHAGNGVPAIAPWLGQEQFATTNLYLHVDMTLKQAIDRTQPLGAKPDPYRPPTPCSPSSKDCDYADTTTPLHRPDQALWTEAGITKRSA